MSYIGNVKVGSTTHLVGSTLYGTCNSAAVTVAKTVTCANFDQLLTGVTIHVKFSSSNTADNPTLNVNGTGAKPIMRHGSWPPGKTEISSWPPNSVVSLTYDGTNWVMNDHAPFVDNAELLKITVPSFSSLPRTVTDSRITYYHEVLNQTLSNPLAQTGNWTIDTSTGSLTITGSISGSTSLTLILGIV